MNSKNNKLLTFLLSNPVESSFILRSNFRLFIKIFHSYIFGKEFIFKDFHLKIIKAIENLVYGNDSNSRKNNLAIAIPPRWGKSAIVKYAIAWFYSINKDCNNIYTSYSDGLVLKFSKEIRDIINSELYKLLFNIELEKDTKSKRRWKIKDGGELYSVALGGSITGNGAGIIDNDTNIFGGALIIDDPLKADDFKSEIARQNSIDYYLYTLKSRLNNPNRTPIILIMQRLHREDLIGYIKTNEIDKWNLIEVRAIDEETNIATWSEKYNREQLKKIKELSPFYFYSQLQQEPIQLGGTLIKTQWFRRYKEVNERYRLLYIVCDTAFSSKTSADNSAFILVGITLENNDLHILDMYVGKMDFVELKNNLINFYHKNNSIYSRYNTISSIYIENKASGQSLIQELSYNSRLPIRELYPTYYNSRLKKEQTSDKYTRYLEISSDIEAGHVYLPEQADWVLDFLSECESFDGLGSYRDDRIDCLIYALKVRRQILNNDNNIDWNKSLDEFRKHINH